MLKKPNESILQGVDRIVPTDRNESILHEADRIVTTDRNESILHEADRIVTTDRNEDYGHPLDDFSKVAALWSSAFGWEVAAEDVGLAMVLLKVSRQVHRGKRDNLVDIAGYAKTLDMIAERRNESL